MTVRRQIVSSPEEFVIHDYTGELVTWVCSEGCPGHDVRFLKCGKWQREANALKEEQAVQHAAEDRETEALDAADTADQEYLDRLDTLGGASPSERRDYGIERRDRD